MWQFVNLIVDNSKVKGLSKGQSDIRDEACL